TPNSEFDSMCSMSLTTVVAKRSFGPMIRCSMSFGLIPGQTQTTLITGLLISGNTSAGGRWIETIPRMTMSSAPTTNVYGRLRARRTIHMTRKIRTSSARRWSVQLAPTRDTRYLLPHPHYEEVSCDSSDRGDHDHGGARAGGYGHRVFAEGQD